MNITKIKEIVTSDLSKDQMKTKILTVLSEDPDVLIYLISILGIERERLQKLTTDMNLEISRYHIHSKNNDLMDENRNFLNEETKNFYEKWKDFVKPLFNNKF